MTEKMISHLEQRKEREKNERIAIWKISRGGGPNNKENYLFISMFHYGSFCLISNCF
jgi:hypothetical protein